MRSDMWIQQNVPGGLNSSFLHSLRFEMFDGRIAFLLGALGERLDNMFGGNPNPTFGQFYGGAPGVGGGYGGGYGYSYGGY